MSGRKSCPSRPRPTRRPSATLQTASCQRIAPARRNQHSSPRAERRPASTTTSSRRPTPHARPPLLPSRHVFCLCCTRAVSGVRSVPVFPRRSCSAVSPSSLASVLVQSCKLHLFSPAGRLRPRLPPRSILFCIRQCLSRISATTARGTGLLDRRPRRAPRPRPRPAAA